MRWEGGSNGVTDGATARLAGSVSSDVVAEIDTTSKVAEIGWGFVNERRGCVGEASGGRVFRSPSIDASRSPSACRFLAVKQCGKLGTSSAFKVTGG